MTNYSFVRKRYGYRRFTLSYHIWVIRSKFSVKFVLLIENSLDIRYTVVYLPLSVDDVTAIQRFLLH